MQRLAEDGLIARQPGRGSFVAEPPAHRRANRLMTFTQEMLRRGRVPSSRLLTRVIRPSTDCGGDRARASRQRQPIVHLRRHPAGRRRADRARIDRARRRLRRRGHDRRPRPRLAPRDARPAPASSSGGAPGRSPPPPRRPRMPGCSASGPATRCSSSGGSSATRHGRRIESTESRYPADRYALRSQFDVEAPDVGRAGDGA